MEGKKRRRRFSEEFRKLDFFDSNLYSCKNVGQDSSNPLFPLLTPSHATERERELFSQSTLDILFLPTYSCPPPPEISNLVRTAFSFLLPSMSTKSRILPRITYHGKWHDWAKNGPLFFFFPFGRGGPPARIKVGGCFSGISSSHGEQERSLSLSPSLHLFFHESTLPLFHSFI